MTTFIGPMSDFYIDWNASLLRAVVKTMAHKKPA